MEPSFLGDASSSFCGRKRKGGASLYGRFKTATGVEGDNATRRDGYFHSGLGVTTRAFRFVSHAEYAEASQLDLFATLKAIGQFLKKGFNHFLGLSRVKSDFVGELFS